MDPFSDSTATLPGNIKISGPVAALFFAYDDFPFSVSEAATSFDIPEADLLRRIEEFNLSDINGGNHLAKLVDDQGRETYHFSRTESPTQDVMTETNEPWNTFEEGAGLSRSQIENKEFTGAKAGPFGKLVEEVKQKLKFTEDEAARYIYHVALSNDLINVAWESSAHQIASDVHGQIRSAIKVTRAKAKYEEKNPQK